METPNKNQLIQELRKRFKETIDWINNQPENHFNRVFIAGKWTIAGHLYHLIKTTKSVSKGMGMPKIGLSAMFGKSNRTERNYDEMVEKYETIIIAENVKSPASYEAESGRTFERSALIKRFEEELNELIEAFQKWDEKDMSIYIMPHPAIGKCTIREFIYFTILHTVHHLDILKEKNIELT